MLLPFSINFVGSERQREHLLNWFLYPVSSCEYFTIYMIIAIPAILLPPPIATNLFSSSHGQQYFCRAHIFECQ